MGSIYIKRYHSSKQIFKDCKGKKGAAVSLGKEDNAFLQYTGGTTVSRELPYLMEIFVQMFSRWKLGLDMSLKKVRKP